jgi:hypothetical protein
MLLSFSVAELVKSSDRIGSLGILGGQEVLGGLNDVHYIACSNSQSSGSVVEPIRRSGVEFDISCRFSSLDQLGLACCCHILKF